MQPDLVPTRALHTVVLVDLVGSTQLAATLGDERWATLLERYLTVLRRELTTAGGEEMDTAGDGLFAVFPEPAAAVVFGCSIPATVAPLGLHVRVGVHTGTCWIAGEKCSGLAVNIGARIAARAEPDEVLVSAAVVEGLAGDARFGFRPRGRAKLKGVPGRWTLHAARLRPAPRLAAADERGCSRRVRRRRSIPARGRRSR